MKPALSQFGERMSQLTGVRAISLTATNEEIARGMQRLAELVASLR